MDINTPFWKAAGKYHRDQACAATALAEETGGGFGDSPERTTYGDVVSRVRSPVPWCHRCGVKGNPAAKGLVDPGVGK